MRIATRLWLSLLGTILLVLGADVLIRARAEQALLLEVTLRDRRFFAHALEQALAGPHPERDALHVAQNLVASDEVADAHIVAQLVALDDTRPLPRPRLPRNELAPLARDEVVVGVYGDELLTYVPLAGNPHTAIELSEPHAMQALLDRIRLRSLWTQALALAALAGLVSFVFVRAMVGRPLTQLASLARQIGAGNLAARASVSEGKHEVAVLGREMNGMAEKLEAARVALEELTAERVTALEQLRHADRLRTVGQLASTLAHELGTPLNVVSGHARLIEQESGTSDEGLASARVILEQTSRMTRILKDLLNFARRKGPPKVVSELRTLALDAARTLEPLARRQRVELSVEPGGGQVHVTLAPQQFLQVLTNLLTNAMQALPDGGEVRMSIAELDAEPPTGIHAPRGRYARLSVVDRGVGIEPDDIPRLFEPFFTRKNEGEGTGLGLAVADGIVREHGGWIAVQSEKGVGSRFDVYVPLSVSAAAVMRSEA